ncbi:hypothetical protein ZWY2020_008880 [Hordeum vulgare]|nr:hypothetical protein ZWY2020_008880 [Hordeum vulgare]
MRATGSDGMGPQQWSARRSDQPLLVVERPDPEQAAALLVVERPDGGPAGRGGVRGRPSEELRRRGRGGGGQESLGNGDGGAAGGGVAEELAHPGRREGVGVGARGIWRLRA